MKKLFKVFGIVFSLFLGLFVLASCDGGLSKSIIEQEAVVSVNENNKLQVVLKQKDHTKIQNALEVKATTVRVALVNDGTKVELPMVYLKDDDKKENDEDYVELLPTTKDESKYDTNEKVYLDGLAFKFTIDLEAYYTATEDENVKTLFTATRPVQVIVNLRKGTTTVFANAEYPENYISISKAENKFTFAIAEKYVAQLINENEAELEKFNIFIGYSLSSLGLSLASTTPDTGWKLGEKEIEKVSEYVFNKTDLGDEKSFIFKR